MTLLAEVFEAVCDASWRASFLVILFLALRPLLRGRVAARIVFWAWIAVAIRLVIPFSAPTSWSPFPPPRVVFPQTVTANPDGVAAAIANSRPLSGASVGPGVAPPATGAGAATLLPVPFSVSRWLPMIWLAGIIVLAGTRVLAARRFERRLRRTSTRPDPPLNALVGSIRAELSAGDCEVIVTELVASPAVHGLFRPKLLFPPHLAEQLAPQELRLVIAHELGHCRHRDLASQGLIQTARVLHWFNPLVWLAVSAAKHDCEIACDEYVVARLGMADHSVYGTALLSVLGMMRTPERLPSALAIMESKKLMKRRIQMILAYRPTTLARTLVSSAILALVAALSMTRQTSAQESSSPGAARATAGAPKGWWKNGNKPAAYEVGVDRAQARGGLPSAYVKSIEPAIDGFGGMMQMCSADNYRGKRLRFSAWMKTENAKDGGTHLWFRVDGQERGEILQFDNMDNRPVTGTTDWHQYSITLDVPPNAKALAYGFFVSGTGQAWVSNVKIEAVGSDVPTTDMTSDRSRGLPKDPENLSFD